MRSRTSFGMSTWVSVEISPATTTRPVVISVSQATRPRGSSLSTASRTESETWSAILSGWPSVTDSDVKRNSRALIGAETTRRLLDAQEEADLKLVRMRRGVLQSGAQGLDVAGDLGRDAVVSQFLGEWNARADVDVESAPGLVRHPRGAPGLPELVAVGK